MKNKPFVTVCSGTVDYNCDKVLDNGGLSIETKEEAESLAILGIINCSHGLCMHCLKLTYEQIDQLLNEKEKVPKL